MKILVGILLLVACASAHRFFDLIQEEWNTFKAIHNKIYSNDVEENFRKKVFVENRIKIAKHNAKHARGQVSFSMDYNHFTDLLNPEFVDVMNGFNRTARKAARTGNGNVPRTLLFTSRVKNYYVPEDTENVPSTIDWRKKGCVTPVKNQGHCGSCYSFSATGSLECRHFLKTGRLVSLSEQNILDCSKSYGNEGCNGGLMDNAFKYVRDNHGLDTEKSYPYLAEDEKCHYNPQFSGASATGMIDIPEGDEVALMNAVATKGAVSVAIDASHESFQFYKTGVYYEPECSNTQLDHGVLVVGYGTDDDGNDYWLIKNSWGEEWGEDGYIRIARNRDNHCGVATQASFPLE